MAMATHPTGETVDIVGIKVWSKLSCPFFGLWMESIIVELVFFQNIFYVINKLMMEDLHKSPNSLRNPTDLVIKPGHIESMVLLMLFLLTQY